MNPKGRVSPQSVVGQLHCNVEVGCLRYPGASTTGSQLPWLANPGNPVMSPHVQGKKAGTCHTEQVSGNMKGRGHAGKL